MPSEPSLRKRPQQARSREMVERIVAAGRDVLVSEGWERATTNRVAERAGISPGSLYQYFPNKDAVLSAVIEQYSTEIANELTAVLADQLHLPPEQLLHAAYSGLLDVLSTHHQYVRLVALDLPRNRLTYLTALESRLDQLASAYLKVGRVSTRMPADHTAWLLVRLAEHLSVAYLLDEPGIDRETFVGELVHLTMAQLR